MYQKLIYGFLFIFCFDTYLFADSGDRSLNNIALIPLLQYERLSLSSQSVNSVSTGIIAENNNLTFMGLYTRYNLKEPLFENFPKQYHSIDILVDAKYEKHQYVVIFKSDSDNPVEGGINTYQSGLVYGYTVVNKPNFSCVFGGGIAIGNFGLTNGSGDNIPIIPVPLIRINYSDEIFEAKFEFLTSPNFNFTLAPKNKFRFIGDIRMDQLRDYRDIIYEFQLAYRPFSSNDEFGDFAGISIGIKNDNYGEFTLGDKEVDDTYELHYNAVFMQADISVLKLSTGYAFNGRSLYYGTKKENIGEGYFVNIQAMYPF